MTARSRERGSHAGRPRGYSLPFPIHGPGTQTPVRPVGDDGVAGPVAPGVPGAETPVNSGMPGVPGLPRRAGHSVVSGFGFALRRQPAPQVARAEVAALRQGEAGRRARARRGRARRRLLDRLRQRGVGRAGRAGIPARLAAGQVRAGGRADQRRRRPGHRRAGRRLHRCRRHQCVLRHEVRRAARLHRNRRVPGDGGPGAARRAVDLHRAVPADLGRRPVADRLGARGHQPRPRGRGPAGRGDQLPAACPDHRHERPRRWWARRPITRSACTRAKLTNEAATAAKFSAATGLDKQQVLGRFSPRHRIPSCRCSPSNRAGSDGFTAKWPKLAKVPGLGYVRRTERLFDSLAQQAVGSVGTEISPMLRQEGAAYQPGMTVGQSGLEKIYQDDLVGTPTTSVVVLNSTGARVATLWSSTGARGHAGADHAEHERPARRGGGPGRPAWFRRDRRGGLAHRRHPGARVAPVG